MNDMSPIASRRKAACTTLLRRVREIEIASGINDASLQRIKALLLELAAQGTVLFPDADFALPEAHGRNHMLDDAADDGYGLYLSVSLPGKEAAPHDHGIWCASAGLSGSELHRFYRRLDDGSRAGAAMVEETHQIIVGPGSAMVMADHDIHSTLAIGDQPVRTLALYGYALTRFPSVVYFHPEFGSSRTMPSRRDAVRA